VTSTEPPSERPASVPPTPSEAAPDAGHFPDTPRELHLEVTTPVVLVVDDDEDSRSSLVEVLAGAGVRAVGAKRGEEALEIQARLGASVAVVGYRLSDGTGIELSRLLKRHDPELPVLLLTGLASIDSTTASVGQLDSYLVKPVSAHTLLQATQNALARRNLVAENRAYSERIQRLNAHQALYDPLTGLPNRVLLDDRLTHALATCRRSGSILAVLFVDLDTFKVVNDLFGHHVGDELLRQLAHRLASARRSSDTVARFGGDEFVVVCPDVKNSSVACRIADHLLGEISAPAVVEGLEHQLTASVGIALSAQGATDQSAEVLLRNADTAMYRAKESGGGAWELFDQTMRDRVMERFEVEQGLRHAIEAGGKDLFLLYQPIVELSSGRVVAAEALLRWNRPGHGTVLPESFLSVAEESGLVLSLGNWTLERAMADLQRARSEGRVPESFRLWVNVSPHQLANPRFAEQVAQLIDVHRVPASMIGVEVVEDVLRDVRATEKALRSLNELGVAISLDDFGAGHSSLLALQDLPISCIKIDRQLVASLDEAVEGRGIRIVRVLLGLGHELGLSVVGEGVETRAQAETLRRMGCDLAQGYHFAAAGPAEQVRAPAVLMPRTIGPHPEVRGN
jgi:diguanylate cyclase (GGDEF)-like protein